MKSVRIAMTLAVLAVAVGASADSLKIGPGVGTDPVVLSTGTSFTVTDNSAKAVPELILFFAVPTPETGSFSVSGASPTLTFVHNFGAILTSSGCGNLYDCVGGVFAGLNASISYTNIIAADAAHGIPVPATYTIYEYSDGSFTANGQVKTFTGVNLPPGTVIAAAGLSATGGLSGPPKGFTAWTDSGFVTTPEPASLGLLGAGMLGLLGIRRIRK